MNFLVIDLETIPKTESAHTWTPKVVDGKEEFPPIHAHKICCIGYCILRDINSGSENGKLGQNIEYNTLFDYSFDDIALINYQSHASIKAPIAV